MKHPIITGALLLVGLAGCAASSVQSLDQQVGDRRIVEADELAADDLSCAQVCGTEARRGEYADCLDAGGDRQDCGHSARLWYRECLESRCTEADLLRDDCTMACRTNAAVERDACIEQTGEAESCRLRSRAQVEDCIATCG